MSTTPRKFRPFASSGRLLGLSSGPLPSCKEGLPFGGNGLRKALFCFFFSFYEGKDGMRSANQRHALQSLRNVPGKSSNEKRKLK